MIVLVLFLSLQSLNWNIDRKGVAIKGYDPVSYFQGQPKEGNADFSYKFKGATFYFISMENMNQFKSDPNKYLPQYGGYCAFAMGDTGEKVDINPKTFKIKGEKLYLFYNSWGNNTLKPWNENEEALQKQADINWNKIIRSNN